MVQKKQTAFRLSPRDMRLLQKLANKKEWSHSAVVREAIKIFARQEGIR